MDSIRHIFFDLDRTLWDFETNSRRVISDLFHEHNLYDRCQTEFCDFISRYEVINHLLWEKLRSGEISKQQLRSSRFYNCMQHYGYDDFELGYRLEEEYVKRSPYQKSLMPGAMETLNHLHQQYKLHIITNGFKEVQHVKLANCGLREFFDVIIISEEVGFAKPDPQIFHEAMKQANALPNESLMVGDDLQIDVHGAINAGMKGVHFDASIKNSPNSHLYTINHLTELIGTLKVK